jgi:hypothetical protein
MSFLSVVLSQDGLAGLSRDTRSVGREGLIGEGPPARPRSLGGSPLPLDDWRMPTSAPTSDDDARSSLTPLANRHLVTGAVDHGPVASALGAVALAVFGSAPACSVLGVAEVPRLGRVDESGWAEADRVGALGRAGGDDRSPTSPLVVMCGVVATFAAAASFVWHGCLVLLLRSGAARLVRLRCAVFGGSRAYCGHVAARPVADVADVADASGSGSLVSNSSSSVSSSPPSSAASRTASRCRYTAASSSTGRPSGSLIRCPSGCPLGRVPRVGRRG